MATKKQHERYPDMTVTDHSPEIAKMRAKARHPQNNLNKREHSENLLLAADLLQCHDDTGISLDNWATARTFVERYLGKPILENGV